MPQEGEFDEIGYWSVVKLEIIKEYAAAYSTILNTKNLQHSYIDAFAGAGQHRLKKTRGFVPGSPINALKVQPPFKKYYLIDLNAKRVAGLRKLIGDRSDVQLEEGDCNEILLSKVFPKVKYEDYQRALCILDPYGLQLQWKVILEAGRLGTIDLFLNFSVMGMNRTVLWHDPSKVSQEQIARMNAFWATNHGEMLHIRQNETYSGNSKKNRIR